MIETPPTPKPVHTIVLDAGPLLKNNPPISSLLARAEELVTTPSVINEVRDPDARARIDTLYLPFLRQRTPTPKSVSFLSEFARKTGDRAVLSKVDLEVLALAYEIECERNGGDWRLRSVPGQKGINGTPPVKVERNKYENEDEEKQNHEPMPSSIEGSADEEQAGSDGVHKVMEGLSISASDGEQTSSKEHTRDVFMGTRGLVQESEGEPKTFQEYEGTEESSESDSEGWITPSNIKKQARHEAASASATPGPSIMQVAVVTTDFACQNVLLQMNLNLLSTATLQRIRCLKTFVRRCHGCFATTKEMNKQFCPRCGKDTLTRVSCSTDSKGQVRLHLKRNLQWNTRGNRYSIPKPVHGNSSGKWKGGGGKGGWGTELILAEDQKKYVRAVSDEQRRVKKERNLMDEDYLPSILTGERHRTGNMIKVGAGRSVNSKKRR